MSNVEEFPATARRMTEYEVLAGLAPTALDAIPGAVCVCDKDGWLIRYNAEAETLWGRAPALDGERARYCGSSRLFDSYGTPLPHAACPMAEAVLKGSSTRNAELLMGRPDGSCFPVHVNVRPLRDFRGEIQGAINFFQDVSSQKALQDEALRKGKDLEDFFENSAIGLHIVSAAGIILRANKAELALLGYTAEEYVGHHIAKFHADAPTIGDILHRLSCGQKLVRYPARLRAKDGSIKHVLITSNSRFKDGHFVNTRCFTTDVTDLHEAENSRRESEERLAATYEAATIGIAEADEQGRLVRVNDAICKMLGRSREELLSMNFLDYTHEDDRSDDQSLYARQVAGEFDSYSIRKRAIKPDGTIVFLDVYSSSVDDAGGRFRYGVRVIQDVTHAKRMEDRLRDSEGHMRELLEALPAAIYTTDPTGLITFYNKAAVEMSGRTPQPGDEWCVTWRLYDTDGAPLPHDQCPMAVALKEDRPVRGAEAVAERPDGTRVPFIPFPTPLHDANGKLIGAINMLVDITERKQAESRQKVLIDELNHRVKNTLATIQSLARQTALHSDSLESFSNQFESRLIALARAHDLLTKRHWVDVPLGTLAREVLSPLTVEAAEQVTLDGRPVDLHPRAALSFTMVLSELATNATKYGSLSVPTGALSVTWRLEENVARTMLHVDWEERGGPAVTPPTRRGFGTRLMQRSIEGDLDGEFDLAFEPDGVICRISIPVGPQHD